MAEHGPSDLLALKFGLVFAGATRREHLLSSFLPHPITNGGGPLFYNCGSALLGHRPGTLILGRLSSLRFVDLNGNGVQDSGEPSAPEVFGGVGVWGRSRGVLW